MKVEHAMMLEDITDAIRSRSSGASRYVVGVAGPPGSGKSTLAESVLAGLKASGEAAAMVPMDGFHLDNAELKQRGLLARKGAPETFDAEGFVRHVEQIAAGEDHVSLPGFDRAADATVPDMHHVPVEHRLVLIEGNYLLLDIQPWARLAPCFDLTIFLAPPTSVLEHRLVQRWRNHGLDEEAAVARAKGNDIPNALTVMGHSADADMNLSEITL